VGDVHQLARDSISNEALASQHSAALRGDIGEERASLCFRVPRHECVLAYEGTQEAFF
jgi:hypothetical protein